MRKGERQKKFGGGGHFPLGVVDSDTGSLLEQIFCLWAVVSRYAKYSEFNNEINGYGFITLIMNEKNIIFIFVNVMLLLLKEFWISKESNSNKRPP